VFLLVEVADTSPAYDREEKLPAYGQAGIAEVWIVNVAERAVELYRELHLGGYASTTVLRAGERACPAAFPDAGLDVAELVRF
jgi:Uma2 family endonuclease